MGKRDPIYSSVDSKGNISYKGPLEKTTSNHGHMPQRTDAYLFEQGEPVSGMYDRGHITASSLSPHAGNDTSNVAPMHSDLNRSGGAYYAMEQGERTALQDGGAIDSSKTAIVNGSPGGKPEIFLVNDNVTYKDGHTEAVHYSFINASYAEQQAWNDQSAMLPGTFDASNPGDASGNFMSGSAYAQLMETTDAELPGIAEDYAAADFSGVQSVGSAAPVSDGAAADTVSDAAASVSVDSDADCDSD